MAISVFAKLLAVLQHAKEFVTELCILERWIHSCPLGILRKATLNALNTGSAQAPSGNNELVEAKVLMHRINTGPRC